MSYYLCKVLTPEFKAKWDTQLQYEIEAALRRKKIPTDRPTFARRFEEILARDSYFHMWNNPEQLATVPNLMGYYKEMGLWEPEFTEVKFPVKNGPLQVLARIEWNGVVKKIEDIDEIFQFRYVEEDELVAAV